MFPFNFCYDDLNRPNIKEPFLIPSCAYKPKLVHFSSMLCLADNAYVFPESPSHLNTKENSYDKFLLYSKEC